jgi:HKD family nuclease
VKILNELRTAKGFTTFVALTFEADLSWFEALLLRQLRKRGVRRFILFVDHSKLSETLKEQGHRLIGSGRSYMLQPVKLNGNFHPKMLLLSGEKSARLYVGSGNLTRGGLDRNLEVFERWDVSIDDEFVPQAFGSVQSYIAQLLDESVGFASPLTLRIVDHAFASPALSKTPVPSSSTEILGSPGSLIGHIEPQATPGGTLRIVSPYFDEKGSMAVEIASRLGVSSFEVFTDLRKTDLTPEAVMTIKKANGRVRKIDSSKHRRPLHAKLFYASSSGRALGVSGSANATNAGAWSGQVK